MRRGVLRYDSNEDRFCLDKGHEMTCFHCGEVLAVRIGTDYVWGRIECDSQSGTSSSRLLRGNGRAPSQVRFLV